MHSSQAACTAASPQGGDSQVSSCSAPSSPELFLQKSGLTFTFLEAAEGHGFVTLTDLLVSWALMTKKEKGGLSYLVPGFTSLLLLGVCVGGSITSCGIISFKLDIYVHIHVSLCIFKHSVLLTFSSFLSLPAALPS